MVVTHKYPLLQSRSKHMGWRFSSRLQCFRHPENFCLTRRSVMAWNVKATRPILGRVQTVPNQVW